MLTLGCEEEYLLVDPPTRTVRPESALVVAAAAKELGGRVTRELTRYQVEVRTDPHHCLTAFARQVRTMRAALARAAARYGLAVISSGAPVLSHPLPPSLSDGPRYARSQAMFGALDDEQSICACHVHIAMPDLATALHVSNHLRTWLPLIIALSANSPFYEGRDTRYASWRTMSWARWPAAGPPPHFESQAHFEDLVTHLIDTETIIDRSGLYWDIRPSHHVPTLEIRAADAASIPEDTVLLVAVVRALAYTALHDIEAGRPPMRPRPETLRAAYWRAARDGLSGQGIDLRTGRLAPAVSLFEHALKRIRPALEHHGDLEAVQTGWRRLQAQGNGADRQRAVYQRRNDLTDVVDDLIQQF